MLGRVRLLLTLARVGVIAPGVSRAKADRGDPADSQACHVRACTVLLLVRTPFSTIVGFFRRVPGLAALSGSSPP